MLPFTKRPGRDESGDNDVVTRDDIVQPPASIPPPPVSKRSVPPPAGSVSVAGSGAMRPKFVSAGEEEMTTLMPTKSLGSAVSSPRPAAGAPPQSRPTPSSQPLPNAPNSGPLSGPPSARSGKFAAIDEEEDGRTVVRGAPKIVKRTGPPNSNKMGMPTSPTTISPAAVIKASLDAARAGIKKPGDHLMAGPPSDLLEDLADRSMASSGGSSSSSKDRHIDVGAEHTAILLAPPVSSQRPMIEGVKALSTQMMQPQPMPHGTIPPGSARPQTNPPPPNSSQNLGGYNASQSGGYNAAQSGGYQAQYNGSITGGSSSVPGVQMPPQSMPAHFMVPQAPYSDGRVDPPGTAVTARTKVTGRPAMSWALALAAFGVFVGVGAVAAMKGNDGFAETSASFVDPSRAAAPKAAAAGAQAATPGTAVPVAVPANGDPATVGVPPVAVPVAAAAPAADPGTVAAPVVTTPATPAAPAAVAAAPVAAAAAPPAAAAAAAATTAKVAAAAPAHAPHAPVAAGPRPQPPRPAAPAAEEKEPVAAAPTTKGGKKGAPAGKGGSEVDEETKKALDALQKSQLESSF